MGWVDHSEQQEILSTYRLHATYRCDYCEKPIFNHQLMVIDPKGGYHPKDKSEPDFLPAKPKRTYHTKCNEEIMASLKKKKGKKGKDAPEVPGESKAPASVSKLSKRILSVIEKKPKPDHWTVTRIIRLFVKKGERKPIIRRAVRLLKNSDQLVKNGKFLYPKKKSKDSKSPKGKRQ